MWLYSLEHSLRQIEPNLAPLVDSKTLEGLKAVSRYFPDALTNTYGFEYRLAPASPTVDFAIHIDKSEGEILAGLHPIQRLPEVFDRHPVWQRIRQFCAAWCDPSSLLHYHIQDLWLEFDLDGDRDSDLPVPGLLFGPTNLHGNPSLSSGYDWICDQALPLLLGTSLPTAVQAKLSQCLAALPPQSSVFQVGLMLTRSLQAVRLCVTGSPSQLFPYLAELGWQGDVTELQAIADTLTPYVDGIILSIDVGEQIYPRIGIEGIFLSRYLPCVNGQWQALLNHLVDQQLCDPSTRDALLQYSGYSIAKAIHQRYYVRGLNHLKLLYQPGRSLAAKIYFGVMHQPINVLAERMGTSNPKANAAIAQPAQNAQLSPEAATQSATTFLLAARDAQGWWTDFRLAAGISDEWVTGYVGTMLAGVSDNRAQEAIRHAWKMLHTRCHRANQTWGYNRFPPGDADSTGWVLQLAAALSETDSDRVQRASRSLLTHQRSDGGFSTYDRPEPIRAFIHAPSEQGLQGWCGSHVCVSAAIATLPNDVLPADSRLPLHAYLHSTQSADGGWYAYWWQDPEYSTALAAIAIATDQPDSESVSRAVNWGLNRLTADGYIPTSDHPDGSPFATAWCLRLLLLRADDPAVQSAIAAIVDWLLQHQQPDGSWTASARLRVPHPHDQTPNQFDQWIYHGTIQGSLVFDHARVFTTATVLQALATFQKHSLKQTSLKTIRLTQTSEVLTKH